MLAVGKPLLSLFGPQFTDGYQLMFILSLGLLARAAIGPIERLLSMLGEQRACAIVYGGAFVLNIGLCLILIPIFGSAGAAIATTTALVIETAILVLRHQAAARLPRLRLASRGALTCTARSNRTFASSGGRSQSSASAAAQWRALAASAIAPNVFYEPAFALAAQPMFGSDVGAGLVWSRGTSPRLLGFFPARIERWRYGIPLPVLVAWTHPYAPLSAPLVDRDAAAAVIAAWLDHVAGDPGLPDVLLLPIAPIGGGLAAAFDAVLTQRGGTSVAFGSHQRALLAPTGVRNTYLDHAISKHKRRTLRWQRRRLGDSGVVSFDSAREPATIAKALGDYLALEAGGWKGRAGTAVRADDALRKFVEGAVTELAGQGKAQVVRLLRRRSGRRRRHRATQRRHRVVLEDRLRRKLRPFISRRAACARSEPGITQ